MIFSSIFMQKMQKTHQGFTLVELMVVIAIIGILAAVGVPKLINYVKTAETEEAVEMAGRINKSLVGYMGSRSGDPIEIVKHIDGKDLKLNDITGDNNLGKLIPTLSLPAGARFKLYKVYAVLGRTNNDLYTCIKAMIDDPDQYVLFSSTPANVDVAGWENHINREKYLNPKGDAPESGGSCQSEGNGAQEPSPN